MNGLNSHVVFGETHNEVVKYDLYILNPRHPINVKSFINKGNNKITELRTILQRESKNS